MPPRVLSGLGVALALLQSGWCQSNDVNRTFAHAIELHRGGDFNAAAREYEAVLASDPTRFDARSNLGAVFSKLGRYQDAIEQYTKALATAPDEAAVPLRLNLGIAYYKSFRISEAATELSKVHESQPGNLNAMLLLSDCELQLGHFSRVIEMLTPLQPSQPENRAINYMLGMALIRDGKVGPGQKLVDLILRDGDSAEGRFLLASGMLVAHNYPDAVKEFARAIALNPNLPSLQSHYGQALLATGDADGAEQAFRMELGTNPNDYEANQRLGEILTHRQRPAEAKPFLDHAALLRPGARVASDIPKDGGGLKLGTPAPDSPTLDLHARLSRGPVVLVFGSYTCPRFRGDADALNKLHAKYGDRVSFELVYVREAHAGGQWQSTINDRQGVDLVTEAHNLGEKQEHAALCVRKLKIPFATVVDGMDRAAESAYDGWPSRVYLVGRDGRVEFNSPLGELDFRSVDLDRAISASLAKKQ